MLGKHENNLSIQQMSKNMASLSVHKLSKCFLILMFVLYLELMNCFFENFFVDSVSTESEHKQK